MIVQTLGVIILHKIVKKILLTADCPPNGFISQKRNLSAVLRVALLRVGVEFSEIRKKNSALLRIYFRN